MTRPWSRSWSGTWTGRSGPGCRAGVRRAARASTPARPRVGGAGHPRRLAGSWSAWPAGTRPRSATSWRSPRWPAGSSRPSTAGAARSTPCGHRRRARRRPRHPRLRGRRPAGARGHRAHPARGHRARPGRRRGCAELAGVRPGPGHRGGTVPVGQLPAAGAAPHRAVGVRRLRGGLPALVRAAGHGPGGHRGRRRPGGGAGPADHPVQLDRRRGPGWDGRRAGAGRPVGDDGLVGAGVVSDPDGPEWTVDLVAVSCRAGGRGAVPVLLAALGRLAAGRGAGPAARPLPPHRAQRTDPAGLKRPGSPRWPEPGTSPSTAGTWPAYRRIRTGSPWRSGCDGPCDPGRGAGRPGRGRAPARTPRCCPAASGSTRSPWSGCWPRSGSGPAWTSPTSTSTWTRWRRSAR